MVGEHHYFVVVILLECVENYGEYARIYHLNGFHLVFGFVSVTALVGSLKVNIYEVAAVFKLFDGGSCLALKVSINVACGTLNLGSGHTGAFCYSFKKVNRRDYSTFFAEGLVKRRQSRLFAFAPKPN